LATSLRPRSAERRDAGARISDARTLATALGKLAAAGATAPLLYLELDHSAGQAAPAVRRTLYRRAATALRQAAGTFLRQDDLVVSGPGAKWFAVLLAERDAQRSSAIAQLDLGSATERLRSAVQRAIAGGRRGTPAVAVRAGWTTIQPRNRQNPLADLRHAIRGAAVVAQLEARRAALLAAVSHELRTPLTCIVGYAERLATEAALTDAQRARALSIIEEEARRLGRLVQSMIDLGAWHAGRLLVRKQPTDMRALAERAAELMSAQAAAYGIRTRVKGSATAHVDPDRMAQVVVNLIDNAIRHSPSGGAVRITLKDTPKRCTLTIEDDGPGFDAKLDTIGSPFNAGDRGRTGLGLAVSATIVSAHGGTLDVRRLRDRGARVDVTLPR
jgi:signal transduction histidine kinase